MPDFRQVDVKAIVADSQRSDFSEEDINKLADAILANEGIIRPLVLKRSGIDSYILIDGHLEYYAAVRAREKNPRLGEVVNSLIVNPKKEAAVEIQLSVLNSLVASSSISPVVSKLLSPIDEQQKNKPSDWITSFEVRLGDIRQDLFQTRQMYEERLNALEKKLEKSHHDDNDLLNLLNTFDADQLTKIFQRYGVPRYQHFAEAIFQARKNKETQQFDSYKDVVKAVKGLGAVTMAAIFDGWHRAQQIHF